MYSVLRRRAIYRLDDIGRSLRITAFDCFAESGSGDLRAAIRYSVYGRSEIGRYPGRIIEPASRARSQFATRISKQRMRIRREIYTTCKKGLIEWRESRGVWARRLVPKRAVARWEQITQPRLLSNPSADTALAGVHGVGASHPTPMSQAIRRLVLLPLEPAPFLSNLFACGITQQRTTFLKSLRLAKGRRLENSN